MKLREIVVKRKAPMITIRGVRMTLKESKGCGGVLQPSKLRGVRIMVHANRKWQKFLQRKEEADRDNRCGDVEGCTVRLKKLVRS